MTSSAGPVLLPVPFPTPASGAADGAAARPAAVDLDGDTAALLDALADRAGGSGSAVLVAAIGVLLTRYTRRAEVMVALTEPATDAVSGVARTQRLRFEVDPGQSLLTLVKSVESARQASAGAPARSASDPFPDPDPDAFPTVAPAMTPAPAPEPIAVVAGGGQLPSAGTTLWVELTPPATILRYDAARWPEAIAAQLARHLAALLRDAASDPDRQLDDLVLLDPEESRAAVARAERTVAHRSDRSTVAERVGRWADRQPDQPAVVAGDERMSYAELVAAATGVADTLRGHGVGRDELVGLLMDRSPELVVCALGVLLAGGAYVGLDPDEPPTRLAGMLADANCRVLITDPGMARRLTEAGDTAVPPATRVLTSESLLRRSTDATLAPPATATAPAATGEDLCYVTYTSGSTGRPKGVLVPHDGVANLVDWYRETFDVRPGDRMPQLARPSFDGWALEVWPCLANGATLHLADRRRLDSPAEFGDWLVEQGITVCFLTTVLARELFGYPWPADRTRLRHLLLGGEKLHRYPPPGLPFRLYNVYGPTETTMLATCGEMDPANPRDAAPPIGHPLTNVRAYVLDERERPVPDGAVGELHLGGAGVARGYLGRPELTAQRFRPDPFTGPPGRMYATGDLVRRLPGGDLAFIGRVDDQVKVRGFRIEPGEIEAALRALPEVRDAIVVVRPGVPGGSDPAGRPAPGGADGPGASGGGDGSTVDRLIGYVVPADPARPPQTTWLREQLGRVLPPFMVPHLFAHLDAVPLTPHGKVARAELSRRPLPGSATAPATSPPVTSAPATSGASRSGASTSPTAASVAPVADAPSGGSAVEELLAALWREVLEVESVDREDSFFDLGGDSLQAMRVAARARERGLHFGAEDLFEHEILHELATELEQRPSPKRGV